MHRAPYPSLVPGARLGRRPFPAAARPAKRFRLRRRVPAAHDALGARPNATGIQSTTAAVLSPPAEFTRFMSAKPGPDKRLAARASDAADFARNGNPRWRE